MIRVIFFDIDGTLVSFDTHTVPKSAIDAINLVKQKGIKIIVATARLLKDIKGLGELDFDGFVAVNGSLCVDTKGNIISKKSIPKPELKSLIAYEKDEMPFSFAFMTDNGTFVNRVDDNVIKICSVLNTPIPVTKDLSTMINEEVYQLKIYVDKTTETQIMQKALLSCESSRWHEAFANVNVKGIDKSLGMREFIHYYNIDQSETMAFGDGGNDIPMLKYAHIGIAMGNANEELKAISDYITTSVDDNGVANALSHFELLK